MKTNKLLKFIILTINAQLLLSPLSIAYAENSKNWNTASNIANGVLNGVSQGFQAYNQMKTGQINQRFSVAPINPNQLPPALQAAGCMVFDAKTEMPSQAVCDPANIGLDPNAANVAKSIEATAENNINELDLFLRSGNEKYTSQGIACYEKARKQLLGQLSKRIEEFRKFERETLKFIKRQEKIATKIKDKIAQGEALLKGKTEDGQTNSLENYDFGKKFKNKACSSFMQSGNFTKTGEQAGLMGIENILRQSFEDSDKGYSASQFISENDNAPTGLQQGIEQDINKLAQSYAKKIKSAAFLPMGTQNVVTSIETSNFTNKSSALNNVISEQLESLNQELDQKRRKLQIEDEDMKNLESGKYTANSIADEFRRKSLNECLRSTIGDPVAFAKSLVNPNISKAANKSKDGRFEQNIANALSDKSLSVEQILNEIKNDYSSGKKFKIKKSESIRINNQKKNLYSGSYINPDQYVELKIQQCKSNYGLNSPTSLANNKASIENQIRSFGTYVEQRKVQFADQLVAKMKTQLISCPTNNTTGKTANSCSSAFDTTNANFCLKTAKICAGNMRTCLDQAKTMVETTKLEQQEHAKAHKNVMKELKVKFAAFVGTYSKKIETESRSLEGMYFTGSTYKSNINPKADDPKNNFDEKFKHLEIENFDKYKEQLLADLKAEKQALIDNSNDIYGEDAFSHYLAEDGQKKTQKKDTINYTADDYAGKKNGFLGELGKHVKNAKQLKSDWEKMMARCTAAVNGYNQAANKANQENAKKNEEAMKAYNKNLAYCKQLQAFSKNGCEASTEASLYSDVMIAAEATDPRSNRIQSYCEQVDKKENELISGDNMALKAQAIIQYCQQNNCNKNVCKHDDYKKYAKGYAGISVKSNGDVLKRNEDGTESSLTETELSKLRKECIFPNEHPNKNDAYTAFYRSKGSNLGEKGQSLGQCDAILAGRHGVKTNDPTQGNTVMNIFQGVLSNLNQ
ncbi:MAG: hypothetical protein N4A33_00825 [Bacteriovoracaceae bacterium]|jgi:hypothetical protein|nr:hypothetical protein [Bacteriovoracaceae bacterium]